MRILYEKNTAAPPRRMGERTAAPVLLSGRTGLEKASQRGRPVNRGGTIGEPLNPKSVFAPGKGPMQGNPKVIDQLNQALRDELTAINQYFLHAEMSENWGYKKYSKYIRSNPLTR